MYPTLCEPGFLPLLAEFNLDQMESDGSTIYGLWPDLTLAYANPSWTRFAAENGGEPAILTNWTLGRCLLDAVAEPLRPFFVESYGRSLRKSRPWEHTYECSSAEIYREFHMTVFPLGRAEGLLVVNSLRVETTHTRAPLPPLEDRYRNSDGIIIQCCHRRRIRRIGNEPVWDWIPDWVTHHPDRTSHGMCPVCFGFYYSESRLATESLLEPFSTVGS